MDTVFYLVVALYGIWILLTAICQLPARKIKLINTVRRLDKFKLLPIWTFFAPNPGDVDHRVIYRDLSADKSEKSGWAELVVPADSKYLVWIWRPHKRLDKLITDSLAEITSCIRLSTEIENMADEPERLDAIIKLSLGYLYILNFVLIQEELLDGAATYRQFAIIDTQGFGDKKLLKPFYLSGVHPIINYHHAA